MKFDAAASSAYADSNDYDEPLLSSKPIATTPQKRTMVLTGDHISAEESDDEDDNNGAPYLSVESRNDTSNDDDNDDLEDDDVKVSKMRRISIADTHL